jgi:hypothetical protein
MEKFPYSKKDLSRNITTADLSDSGTNLIKTILCHYEILLVLIFYYNSVMSTVLAITSFGWRRWPPDMEGSCKYTE